MDSTGKIGTWSENNGSDSDSIIESGDTVYYSANSNSLTESSSIEDEKEGSCCSLDDVKEERPSEDLKRLIDTDSGLVQYTGNGALEIPNGQQTHVQIKEVTNLYQQQFITDDGTDLFLERTNSVMEKEECYFDISETKAWKNFLSTYKIAIVVGFSESFKRMFCKEFYQKYTSCGDVFRLNGPEDWKICYKRPQPFAIFMKDAFGPFGTKSEGISDLIYDLTNLENLEAALFTMDPLAFKRNKEDLKRHLGKRLADYVINLEDEEHLLSENEKREILKKTFERVENYQDCSKQDNDRICFENFIEDILDMAENPIFFDTCQEFIVYRRHDKNVLKFFALPLNCLVDEIMYLKEKWADGYYVLRLVAFLDVFDQSEKEGELASILKQAIHGNLIQILNQLEGVYLKIQNNNVGARKFVFRHRMMQYAVLCTESDKPFLIHHCPIGFLVEVVTRMTNLRCISFNDEYRSIARRFIQEILQGQNASTLVFHEIWNSEEFLDGFKQEWKTVEKQRIVSNLKSPCESNFLYLVVFTKSSELLHVILKTCKEHKLILPLSLLKKAIYAACVIGHFKHFELLMQRIDVDKVCRSDFEKDILKPRRDTVNSKFVFDKLECLPSIIHTAVAFNRLDILNYLKNCRQNVNYTDSRGYTSLHVACHGSDIEIIEYLNENNCDVAKVARYSGNTCLHEACRCGNIEIVSWLVKYFPKLVLKRNNIFQTPLQTAVGAGNTQIVKLLIEISNKFKKKCLLDKDSSGCTVLHLACKVPNNLHMVRFLVERQPSLITIQDHRGNTALHAACQTQGNTAVAEYLVSKGMDINIVNASLRTPLHKAYRAGNVEVSEFLLLTRWLKDGSPYFHKYTCTYIYRNWTSNTYINRKKRCSGKNTRWSHKSLISL